MGIINDGFSFRWKWWNGKVRSQIFVQYKTDKIKDENIDLPGIYGYAEGIKDKRTTSIGVTIDGDINSFSMGEATSLPLATGVKMFIDGEIKKYGVHTPESSIIDPKLFFYYFKKEAGDNIALNTVITRKS